MELAGAIEFTAEEMALIAAILIGMLLAAALPLMIAGGLAGRAVARHRGHVSRKPLALAGALTAPAVYVGAAWLLHQVTRHGGVVLGLPYVATLVASIVVIVRCSTPAEPPPHQLSYGLPASYQALPAEVPPPDDLRGRP